MKFPKRMSPIIIQGHEAVDWFKSKSHAERQKKIYEQNGFHVILYQETENWDAWFVYISNELELQKLMIEGYDESAVEDLKIAKEFEVLDYKP